jgi:hypothetical protein
VGLGADIIRNVFGSLFRLSRGFTASHDGIDLAAPRGTPVYAVAPGVVTYAKNAAIDTACKSNWACGGGNVVNIDVGDSKSTQYAHLDKFVVAAGQTVSRGQLIGYVGSTGNSTGPHLHFGLWDRAKNKMIDPTPLLLGGAIIPKTDLGAWGDLVKFPVGHVITAADVDTMMSKLRAGGFFSGDTVLGGSETKTREILMTAVGKPWDKSLQDSLQQSFFGAAQTASNNPFQVIGDAIGSIGSLATKLVAYTLAVLFILFGLWLYSRSQPGPAVEVPSAY